MTNIWNRFPRSMGCPNQNFIAFDASQRDDYVRRHIKNCDVYGSVYSFGKLTESNELDRTSAIIDKIFIDLDVDWFKDLMKLHYWCEHHAILHYIQFSGNGSQAFIPIVENVENKKAAVGNFQRWINQQLDMNIDKKTIGDTSRICRYPNTYNFKGRRFCIPIPADMLNPSLTEEWLWKHSTHQMFENAWSGSKLLNLKRWDVPDNRFMEVESAEVNLAEINPSIPIDYPQFPPCVQQWLSTPLLTDEAKFHLVIFLKDQLYTPAPFDATEIMSILKRTLSQGEFGHYFGNAKGDLPRRHQGHQGRKFRDAMVRDYYMKGCEELKGKGLCTKDCGRRNPIYD